MREIAYDDLVKSVKAMVMHTASHLPEDALAAIEKAYEEEQSEVAKSVLKQILDNAHLASEEDRPLCQDTGLAVYFINVGEDVKVVGGSIRDAINQATEEAYKEGYLRASTCDCFDRHNLKDEVGYNLPAVIHFDIVPGDRIEIEYAAKGGGSENVSRATVLAPAQGKEGIKNFVKQVISDAGPNPCPPIIVGVGIGGTFEVAAKSSKHALFREAGTPNPTLTWMPSRRNSKRSSTSSASGRWEWVGPRPFWLCTSRKIPATSLRCPSASTSSATAPGTPTSRSERIDNG